MLKAGLIVSRFLHYTATLTLFGLSLFPLYTSTELTAAPYMRRATIWLTALAALLSGVFWVMSVAFSMAGTLDGDSVWSVLSETSFGKVWMARFILVTIILVLAKLVLFTGMLGLAGLNRFLIVPSLIKGNNGGHVAGLTRLCRHICGEQALGVVIMLIVSALGTMQPAIN
jgi:putative copper export protein